MAKVEFTYRLHDDLDRDDRLDEIAASAGIPIDDELGDKIGRPFYEVVLRCTLDVETGKIEVLGVTA